MERDTHVVEVLYGEAVALDSSDAIDEECAGCAHEAAGGRGREGAFEGAKKDMRVEGGRGVWRGWAGRDGGTRLVVLEPDEQTRPARSMHGWIRIPIR